MPDYSNPDLTARVISGSDFSTESRNRQADFEDIRVHLSSNLSTTKRPDAVSFDYLTSFTYGPVGQGDSSLGSNKFAWKIRTDGRKVLVARQNDGNNAWLEETVLFEIPQDTAVIEEIDSAFDQNARIFFAVQRTIAGVKQIWAYYYDPFLSAYTFSLIANGRTPRCILDNPQDISASDILLFYISDDTDVVNLRQQRDRYGVDYATPITQVTNKYLEEVSRSRDNRIHLVYSEHDPATGKYTLTHIESTLYPYVMEIEQGAITANIITVELRDLLLVAVLTDSVDLHVDIVDSVLRDKVIQASFFDVDSLAVEVDIQDALLRSFILDSISGTSADNLSLTTAIQSSDLRIILIIYPFFDIDSLSATASIQSAALI